MVQDRTPYPWRSSDSCQNSSMSTEKKTDCHIWTYHTRALGKSQGIQHAWSLWTIKILLVWAVFSVTSPAGETCNRSAWNLLNSCMGPSKLWAMLPQSHLKSSCLASSDLWNSPLQKTLPQTPITLLTLFSLHCYHATLHHHALTIF